MDAIIKRYNFSTATSDDYDDFIKEIFQDDFNTMVRSEIIRSLDAIKRQLNNPDFPNIASPGCSMAVRAIQRLVKVIRSTKLDFSDFQKMFYSIWLTCLVSWPTSGHLQVMCTLGKTASVTYYMQGFRGDDLKNLLAALRCDYEMNTVDKNVTDYPYYNILGAILVKEIIEPVIKKDKQQLEKMRPAFLELYVHCQVHISHPSSQVGYLHRNIAQAIREKYKTKGIYMELSDYSMMHRYLMVFEDAVTGISYPRHEFVYPEHTAWLSSLLQPLREIPISVKLYTDEMLDLMFRLYLHGTPSCKTYAEKIANFLPVIHKSRFQERKSSILDKYLGMLVSTARKTEKDDASGKHIVTVCYRDIVLPLFYDESYSRYVMTLCAELMQKVDPDFVALVYETINTRSQYIEWKKNTDFANEIVNGLCLCAAKTPSGEDSTIRALYEDLAEILCQKFKEGEILRTTSASLASLILTFLHSPTFLLGCVASVSSRYVKWTSITSHVNKMLDSVEEIIAEKRTGFEKEFYEGCIMDIFDDCLLDLQGSSLSPRTTELIENVFRLTTSEFLSKPTSKSVICESIIKSVLQFVSEAEDEREKFKPFVELIVELCQVQNEAVRTSAITAVLHLTDQPHLLKPYMNDLLNLYFKNHPSPILDVIARMYSTCPDKIHDKLDNLFDKFEDIPTDDKKRLVELLKDIAGRKPEIFDDLHLSKLDEYSHKVMVQKAVLAVFQELVPSRTEVVSNRLENFTRLHLRDPTLIANLSKIFEHLSAENEENATKILRVLADSLHTPDLHINYQHLVLLTMMNIGKKRTEPLREHQDLIMSMKYRSQLRVVCQEILRLLQQKRVPVYDKEDDNVTSKKTDDDDVKTTPIINTTNEDIPNDTDHHDHSDDENERGMLDEPVSVEKPKEEPSRDSVKSEPSGGKEDEDREQSNLKKLVLQRTARRMTQLSTEEKGTGSPVNLPSTPDSSRQKYVSRYIEDLPEDSVVDLLPIYISYHWSVSAKVSLLQRHLSRYGFEGWVDDSWAEIETNGSLPVRVERAVGGCEIVIVCICQRSLKSKRCIREMKEVSANNKTVIPVLMENVKLPLIGQLANDLNSELPIRLYKRGDEKVADGKYWTQNKFQELLVRLRYYLVPNEERMDAEIKLWWNPVEDSYVTRQDSENGGRVVLVKRTTKSVVKEKKQLYISYHWDQHESVMALYKRLSMSGYRCWLDFYHMGSTRIMRDEIDDGQAQCSLVLACVSRSFMCSPINLDEMRLAQGIGRPIFALVLDNVAWPPEEENETMWDIANEAKTFRFHRDYHVQSVWTGEAFERLLAEIKNVLEGKTQQTELPPVIPPRRPPPEVPSENQNNEKTAERKTDDETDKEEALDPANKDAKDDKNDSAKDSNKDEKKSSSCVIL